MKALLVADGDVPQRVRLDEAWPGWDDGVELVIAADGGAPKAVSLGLSPHVVVGDADSIDAAELARLESAGTRIRLYPTAKDASDTELGLAEAVGAGATVVTILGALGGLRFDHAIANVLLLALDRFSGCEVTLLDGTTRVRLIRAGPSGERGEIALRGRVGELVSLFPLGEAHGLLSEGLEYPLRDEPLAAGTTRGLSNVRLEAEARISLAGGRLLIVETTQGAVAPAPTPGGSA
ncbi:MAG TPA: thiamine diphosphokinase [Candidatus Limnocylindrales bacterium]|jgi:thiamine pyrophosphokinase|nr:thiamine diphosphokinase [Candidatus Limnocylindrales bacterium]